MLRLRVWRARTPFIKRTPADLQEESPSGARSCLVPWHFGRFLLRHELHETR